MQTANNFLAFPFLSAIPNLRHALSTRHTLSLKVPNPAPYEGLNLAFHVGDDAEQVRRNRETFASSCDFDFSSLVASQQTHETRAAIVTQQMRGQGALDYSGALPHTDALITREKDVPLLILVADCAPLLLADETAHVLAVVHAGWRGAVGRIVSQTVTQMQTLGANPRNIAAGIGPHLCVSCFEIGEEVADAAQEITPNSIVRGGVKPHLNLEEVLRADLGFAGISKIETMDRCPRCENETFFSHRAQNGVAGRFGLVAWWE